jgi:hypothetical protein
MLVVAAGITAFPAFAVDFSIEDSQLRPVPAQVLTAIKATARGAGACTIQGAPVDLDGDGKKTDWVATTADACDCGHVICPIWLIRDGNGKLTVVLAHGGYDLTLGRAKQHGLRHVAIAAASAGWKQQSLWKFDGTRYVRVKETRNVAH